MHKRVVFIAKFEFKKKPIYCKLMIVLEIYP